MDDPIANSSTTAFEETKSSAIGLSTAERKARREELRVRREQAKAQVVIANPIVSNYGSPQDESAQNASNGGEITISPAVSEGRLRRDSIGTAGSVEVKSVDKSMDALDTLSERHTTRSMASTRKSAASSRTADPKRAQRDEQRRKMLLEAQALLKQKVETVSQPDFVPTVTAREQDLLGARPTLNIIDHRAGSHLSASSSEAPTRHQSVIESNLSANGKDTYLKPQGETAGSSTLYSSPASPAARDPHNDADEAPAIPQQEQHSEKTPLLINGSPSKAPSSLATGDREAIGKEGPILIRVEPKPEKERPRWCCWGCCSCACCGKNPDCCCYTPCSNCCRKERAPCVIQ